MRDAMSSVLCNEQVCQKREVAPDPQKVMGARIRERRKQLALSMADLTELTGVDSATTTRAENGTIQITFETAIQLSRALQLPLTELVGPARLASPGFSSSDIIASNLLINDQDVSAIVKLYRTRSELAEGLIAKWLNRLADQIDTHKDDERIAWNFRQRDVQFLLLQHNLVQIKVRLPTNSALIAVPAMHQFGGNIDRVDIQLLLIAISNNRDLLQKLDRQSRDILQRLQSHTPNRIRVVDLAKLEKELGIDLLGTLAVAEGVSGNDLQGDEKERKTRTNEAQLISLFVTVACWFQSLQQESTGWISALRTDIRNALQRV